MTAPRQELLTPASERSGWLDSYARSLRQAIPASADIVVADSCDIADAGLMPPGDVRWGSRRVRTGAVVGAVQSGKTASLIGITARAVDTCVDVVVILGGRQISLWHQTTERIRRDLIGNASLRTHAFLPESGSLHTPDSAYSLPPRRARRLLQNRLPIIFVAMKEVHHLQSLGAILRKSVYDTARELDRDIHLLVIDDEADDASVADDRVQFTASEVDEFQEVPRRIIELWEDRHSPGHTYAPNVYVTYVAYTATPQANFLQNADNPLAPRNFVAALRTPGPHGMRSPRELTYRASGAARWYTGADIYYQLLVDVLCEDINDPTDTDEDDVDNGSFRPVPNGTRQRERQSELQPTTTDNENQEFRLLTHAVRTYLVAAAIRVIRSDRLGPRSAEQHTFNSEIEAKESCAPVMSMLIHSAATMESHFLTRDLLARWWNGRDGTPGSGVLADLGDDCQEWIRIYDGYCTSAQAVEERLAEDSPDCRMPTWHDVEKTIREEIIPGTRVAVINSHADSDERPEFRPHQDEDGSWHVASHHSTIFVSGNVMSRGLTLEGLLTTVFTRASNNPLADTQMQMQRWFGYRGSYIDLCRVLMTPTQRSLFTQYSQVDDALRRQVLSAMEAQPDELPSITVLQGKGFSATGKVASLSSVSLLPGSRPVVRYMNDPSDDEHNLELISSFFQEFTGGVVVDRRGLLTKEPLNVIDTASLLDGLRYRDHGYNREQASRWAQIESIMELSPRLNPEITPIYRAPMVENSSHDLQSRSPYVLAAYLRTWAAAADRAVPGLISAEDPPQLWNLIDRGTHRARLPHFHVGLRFGGGTEITCGPLGRLGKELEIRIRPMRREVDKYGQLVADWGSRGIDGTGDYQGDDIFDSVILGSSVERLQSGARAPGQKGLLLFQLIDRQHSRASLSVAMSIPAGGPDYMQAVNIRNRKHES